MDDVEEEADFLGMIEVPEVPLHRAISGPVTLDLTDMVATWAGEAGGLSRISHSCICQAVRVVRSARGCHLSSAGGPSFPE
jgi:hypothetical protein